MILSDIAHASFPAPAQRMCDEGAARRFEQKSSSCFHFYSVLVPFHFILSYSILILVLFDLSSTSSKNDTSVDPKYENMDPMRSPLDVNSFRTKQ